MKLTLNIYDAKGKKVERTATGETYDIMLGTIENLLGILDIENADNDMDIVKKIHGAYKELRVVLCQVFGDIEEDEWKRVKVKELVPVLKVIIKYTFIQMQELPTDPN